MGKWSRRSSGATSSSVSNHVEYLESPLWASSVATELTYSPYLLKDIGGNPSALEASEDMETETKAVVDVCDAFRLEETIPKHLEKKQYLSQLKGMSIHSFFQTTHLST